MAGPGVVRAQAGEADGAAVERAGEVLRAGGVIAVPTDTVYGLVADPHNEEAAARIYGIKDRDPHKPLAALAAGADAAWALCEAVPDEARRLALAFWPGALTLVLRAGDLCPASLTAADGFVGVRVPRCPFVCELARRGCGVLASTSANPSGGPDPLRAEDVIRLLGGGVDLVVDGGATPGASASTVVRLGGGAPEVLREGAVSSRAILWALADGPQRVRSLLFVCTANICRSAYAERKMRAVLGAMGVGGIGVSSAGVMAGRGSPMYRVMAEELSARGGDPEGHRSQPLSAKLVARADLILCMEGEHLEIVCRAFPKAAERAFLIGSFVGLGCDIADPVMQPGVSSISLAADRIDLAVEILAERLRAWRRE